MVNIQKDAKYEPESGLLDLVILQLLSSQPMHSLQIAGSISKTFGITFEHGILCALLYTLETRGSITSTCALIDGKPQKIYMLADEGKSNLAFVESCLNAVCKKLSS